MDNEQIYDQGRDVLDRLAVLHQDSNPERLGLGAWILRRYYPEVSDSVLAACDEELVVRPLMLARWAMRRLDFSKVSHLSVQSIDER